jgi:hypothetical protein
MDICLEMLISYLFLFLAFTVDLREAQNGCDDQLRYCGAHGPAIRFPFRLSSQPEHCGYPGFNLSCTDANQTVLELPISVKLFVKEIDYKSQVIQLYDPYHCFPRQLRGLDLSSSHFHFKLDSPYDLDDYALFSSPIENRNYKLISCLSGLNYQVYATYDSMDIAQLPLSATKMYNLLSIPYTIMVREDEKILELKWSRPVCKHCEVKGKKCRLKNNSTESTTECFSKLDNKGIVLCPILHLCTQFLHSFYQANMH